MMPPVCRAPGCGGALKILLETGEHPVSNGYVRQDEVPLLRPLTLCQCPSCGLLQLAGTFSVSELADVVPDWVRYNEPEAHLDAVAKFLGSILGGDCRRHVAGLTYIDQSLQDRLRQVGLESQCALDVLNGADPVARCSIENMLSEVQSGHWQSGKKKIDLLIARHVFDHTRDMATFITFIRSCLADDGLVMFEVPNSISDIEAQNPLMLWESHANYFTPSTLLRTLESAGLKVVSLRQFMPGGAPVLIAICALHDTATFEISEEIVDISLDAVKAYASRFWLNREELRCKLKTLCQTHTKLAILGAGHIGNLFLNLHDIGSFFHCAVDDDKRKTGLFLPGSGLPIQASATLASVPDLFVLMAVNPSVEKRVMETWRQMNPHAVFGSIFAQSSRSLSYF